LRTFVQPNLAQRMGAAFIDFSSCHADVEQAANDAFLQATLGNVRFQLGNASLQKLAMQKRFAGLARPSLLRIDPERRLKQSNAADSRFKMNDGTSPPQMLSSKGKAPGGSRGVSSSRRLIMAF